MLKLYIYYVIFFKTKEVIIIKLINWCLLNDKKIVKNFENVECEFNNKILEFKEDDNALNKIDLINDKYTRETDEFTFQVNFKTKECHYNLKELNKSFSMNIDGEITIENNKITLRYSLDDEEKQIIIQIL